MSRFLQVLFGVTVIEISSLLALVEPIAIFGIFFGYLFFLAPVVQAARDYDELTRRP